MYRTFYGMTGPPFCRDAPVDDVCRLRWFEEAAGRLLYTAKEHGFAVVTGPCGTGKTTLLRCVSTKLTDDRYKVIYLSDSALSPGGFYRSALASLGITPRRSCSEAKQQLASALKNMPGYSGMQPVFVLDEAHMFSDAMLEETRFILNSNFDSCSSAGLILCGQDELLERISAVSMAAIRQRVDLICSLKPLERAETQTYIEHRLSKVGVSTPLFTELAVDAIHEFSGGIPRLTDKVCTNLLIYGCQLKKRILDDHDAALVLENEFII